MRYIVNRFSLISLIILVITTSCSEPKPTQSEIVKKNIEEYITPKLNDPESYEFVELTLVDSVLYRDNIKYRKNNFNERLENNFRDLKRLERYKIEIPSLYDESQVERINKEIGKNQKILLAIDSLEGKLGLNKNDVASFTYLFKFRSTNGFGAKVLNEYMVQTSPKPELQVINMTDDKDKIFLNPNDFPGYRQMIKEFIE